MSGRIFKILIPLCACAILAACIKNDIPYPRIQANFLTFTATGQDRGAVIDSINRTVTLYFGEETDIQNVSVEEYTLTPGATVVGETLSAPLDLSKPQYVTLHLYQDWQWTVAGVQDIERYFTVTGQVGASYIDVPGRRVVVYINKKQPLSKVYVESVKLGPTGSVISPALEGEYVNLSKPLEVKLQEYGRVTTWTIFAEQTDAEVTTMRADAWTNVAWVYGEAQAGKNNGIQYRIEGDTEWTTVPDSEVTHDGGNFRARIVHLSPETAYEARAYSDDAFGEVVKFTTGSVVQVPNTNLDEWWLNGKVWNPWPEGGTPYWDTGNKGATTLGPSNSTPTDDTSTGTGWAARLETKFVGIGALGKLAAGNLFVGLYFKTDGTNGILHFGRPFTQRPTKLRGYLKYTSSTINYASDEWTDLKGQPDTCIVWCALIDQNEPFEIRTNPRNRQLFDSNGSYVVAYGKVEYGQTIENYIPFEFELDYKSTSRVPKYILITASASKYGDYFTGGTGSVLYLDDLELLYDY